ncbi:O-antigen ligase [Massilia sp. ST3]|uniref:O-antigen ligase family protein n=1 Tax=Massilia sp. ST3 TaxID=2824903 RepID=UPI001B8172EE|nr:O-antigen ligase family protein [Massilia sp. ST3]MBQ5947650.1 O-antigen ligase family protein [Massilia sp. ST3]
MNNKPLKSWAPMQLWIGFQVFLFPFISLITPSGIGFSSLLFVLTLLFVPRQAWTALAPHWKDVRWVVAAFAFQLALVAVCVLLRPEADLARLDKPSRMLMGFSAAMLVLLARPPRALLWWGVAGGAVAALPFILWQRIVLGEDRPGGFLNAITFGDLALCLGLLALAAAVDYRHSTRKALLPALGAVAGLAASVATGSRGGWIALALAGVLFLCYAQMLHSRRVRLLLVGSFALVGATFFIPATGMQERAEQGVVDVRTWMNGGSAFSNVGIRLELWKGAAMLIAERPFTGLDAATVRAELRRHVEAGELDPAILPLEHLHNDALQALATGGVWGLLAWAGILLAPFLFFSRELGRGVHMGMPQFAPALAGMLVVLSYFSFGLTEVIFWSLKGCMFYALMVFLLMGFCLIAKEKSGK